MIPRIFALLLLLAFAPSARASDNPIPESISINTSGVAVGTTTFTQIQAQNGGRHDCIIENNSSGNSMYIYFGTCANATSATSYVLSNTAGANVYRCASPGILTIDSICIAGTNNDKYTALFW